VTGYSVHGASKSRADCHHPSAEGLTVVGFDDEMRVISLERVMDEAESRTNAARGEAAFNLPHDACGAQRR